MRMLPICRRVLAAGAVLALALPTAPAPAAPSAPAAPDKDNALSPIEKVRQELDKPITIKLDNQTLSAALDQLRKTTKINIVVDSLTIQQQLGFLPEQSPLAGPIDLKEVKVRTALRTILAPFALDYVAIGDMVVVTTEDMAVTRQLRQRISVDMDKVEFAAALKQISRDTAANLILDSRVAKQAETKVTLHLEDVPLETAVRLLSEMAGLKPVRVGNVLFVTSKDNANEMRQDPDISQPNPAARAEQLQQLQQLQLQLGAQAPGLGGPAGGAALGPITVPNVPPAVPPAVDLPKDDKPAPDAKPGEDKPKEQKDAPPPDLKPLTK